MVPPCELTVRRAESGYLIRLVGRGTRDQSPAVRDFVVGALSDGACVILDLSGCEYLDSTFLGCLAVLSRARPDQRGHFAVLADAEVCHQLFGVTRLQKVLSLAERPPACQGDAIPLPTLALERHEFGCHLLETHEELAQLGGPQATTYQAIVELLTQELKQARGGASN